MVSGYEMGHESTHKVKGKEGQAERAERRQKSLGLPSQTTGGT